MVSISTDVNVSRPASGAPKPLVAYVLYGDEQGASVATEHPIINEALGIGEVVSISHLAKTFEEAREGRDALSLLPANVLMDSTTTLLWTRRARKQPMWFNVSGKRKGYTVWWPTLLFLADKGEHTLRVFALKNGKRPSEDSQVYNAPIMNVSTNGLLCEGSAELPRELSMDTMGAIEACVTDSCFTHVNHPSAIKGARTNKDHIAYWRNKERSGDKVRAKELVPYRHLSEVINP